MREGASMVCTTRRRMLIRLPSCCALRCLPLGRPVGLTGGAIAGLSVTGARAADNGRAAQTPIENFSREHGLTARVILIYRRVRRDRYEEIAHRMAADEQRHNADEGYGSYAAQIARIENALGVDLAHYTQAVPQTPADAQPERHPNR